MSPGRALPFLSALALAGAIGFVSWQDIQPQARSSADAGGTLTSGYYADAGIPASLIPDDSLPVTIAQGKFEYVRGKPSRFIQRGLAPFTLAQRQINLMVQLDSLPSDDGAVDALGALIRNWKKEGNIVSDIFLDYRPASPDFLRYAEFIKMLKQSPETKTRRLIPVVDYTWLEDGAFNQVLKLQEAAPLFLLAGTEGRADKAAEAARKDGVHFQLFCGMEDTDAKPLAQNPLFEGCLVRLDQNRPVTKKEPVMKLFPLWMRRDV